MAYERIRAVRRGAHTVGVARAMLNPRIMKRALFVVFLLGCPLVAGRLGSAPVGDGDGTGPVAGVAAPQRISALAHTTIAAHEPAQRDVRVVPSASDRP